MCLLTCVRHDFPHLGGCYGNNPTSARNTSSQKAQLRNTRQLFLRTYILLDTQEATVHQFKLNIHGRGGTIRSLREMHFCICSKITSFSPAQSQIQQGFNYLTSCKMFQTFLSHFNNQATVNLFLNCYFFLRMDMKLCVHQNYVAQFLVYIKPQIASHSLLLIPISVFCHFLLLLLRPAYAQRKALTAPP